jgi:hypothetical protein
MVAAECTPHTTEANAKLDKLLSSIDLNMGPVLDDARAHKQPARRYGGPQTTGCAARRNGKRASTSPLVDEGLRKGSRTPLCAAHWAGELGWAVQRRDFAWVKPPVLKQAVRTARVKPQHPMRLRARRTVMTASSNPATISSTTAARHGTSSSTSLGGSGPLVCANGRTGFDKRELALVLTRTCVGVQGV